MVVLLVSTGLAWLLLFAAMLHVLRVRPDEERRQLNTGNLQDGEWETAAAELVIHRPASLRGRSSLEPSRDWALQRLSSGSVN